MAKPAASAALAAHEQGKFWEFHDRLFALSKITKVEINKIAVDLELDIPRFQKDMTSPKVQNQIKKDLFDAKQAGVTGTPALFFNGRKPKQRSPEGLQAIVDEELKKLENK